MRTYILLGLITSIAVAPVLAEQWAGLYRKTDGSVIGIGALHEFGKAEVLVDYGTGEAGQLFPLPDARAGVGHGIGDHSPPPVHALERRNKQVWFDGQALREIPVTRRQFEVKNGPIKLAGELVRTAEKPKGAIVLVHGSGDGLRRAYDIWTNFFASQGWAVVVYDKRGSGDSTGDWHNANFTVLASDTRAF